MHLNDAPAASHRAGGGIPLLSNPYPDTYAPPPAIADFNFIDLDLASSPQVLQTSYRLDLDELKL